MAANKPKGHQQQSQRTLDQLAQANSYTYTLQQPMSAKHQRLNSKRNQTTSGMGSTSQEDDEDDEDMGGEGEESEESEESKLSDYSPNEEVRGFFHKPQNPAQQQ
jgi:hypothetical protein